LVEIEIAREEEVLSSFLYGYYPLYRLTNPIYSSGEVFTYTTMR